MRQTNLNIANLLPIEIDGRKLDERASGDFLGVTVDQNLKFDAHISKTCKKVSKSIGVLYKIKDYLSYQTRRQLYFTLIFPYLNYCNLVWGATHATHLNSLFILQKKVIRIINKKSYYHHTDELFKSSRILKLREMYTFNVGVHMFRETKKPGLFPVSTYPTRSINSLIPQFQRLSSTQRSIQYKGPKIWNEIPTNIRNSPNLNIFKNRFRNYLLS